MQILPLFKTHYSLGKSILTLEKPTGNIESYPVSVIDLAIHAKIDFLTLVEDNMTGFLEASKHCQDKKLKLIFGLRLSVTNDVVNQDEQSLKNRAKYIIFAKNSTGYKALIKIWSFAAKDGFYYNACIDFKNLKRLWNDNLILAIPFYDSFLHLNSLEGHFHVPDFSAISPIVFIEDNQIPFDPVLRKKASDFANSNNFPIVETRSIFYKSKLDFISYLTFKCISERTSIEKPEFNHMGSDSFNYDRWLAETQKI
jgi:DNA polymerase III alpha subunit